MAKKILQVLTGAYRVNNEEQDDPGVWITHSVKGAGADTDLLLQGNAVNYLVKDQDASGLAFGDKRQTQPPRLQDDVAKLMAKGVVVHFVTDDAAERGLEGNDFIAGAQKVARAEVARLYGNYDQVWHW